MSMVPPRRPRRERNGVLIGWLLDTFRRADTSKTLRDTLAEISMRLIDAEDRHEFQRSDGATALGERRILLVWQIDSGMEWLMLSHARVGCSGSSESHCRRASRKGVRVEDVGSLRKQVALPNHSMRHALIMLIALLVRRWSKFEVLDSLQFTCKS